MTIIKDPMFLNAKYWASPRVGDLLFSANFPQAQLIRMMTHELVIIIFLFHS